MLNRLQHPPPKRNKVVKKRTRRGKKRKKSHVCTSVLCRHAVNTQLLCAFKNPTTDLPSVMRQIPDRGNVTLRLKCVTSSRLCRAERTPLYRGCLVDLVFTGTMTQPKHLMILDPLIRAAHSNLRVFLHALENANINKTPTDATMVKTRGGYYQSDVAPARVQSFLQ